MELFRVEVFPYSFGLNVLGLPGQGKGAAAGLRAYGERVYGLEFRVQGSGFGVEG